MAKEIIIKGSSKENIIKAFKPLLFACFALYFIATTDFSNATTLGRNIFFILNGAVLIIAIYLFNNFQTDIIINDAGIREKGPFTNRMIGWEEIKSIDVVLSNDTNTPLKKEDYHSNIYIFSKKIIVLSSILKDQLYQSASTKRKKIFYLPFRKDIIKVLVEKNILESNTIAK